MRLGKCKHFNGLVRNERCDAGVLYRDVTPHPDEQGSGMRIPCIRATVRDVRNGRYLPEEQGTCDRYEDPSKEELEQYRREIEEDTARYERALAMIAKVKQLHGGESWSGVVECPECGGRLHMSHAAINGHTHGRCETKGCLAWME